MKDVLEQSATGLDLLVSAVEGRRTGHILSVSVLLYKLDPKICHVTLHEKWLLLPFRRAAKCFRKAMSPILPILQLTEELDQILYESESV